MPPERERVAILNTPVDRVTMAQTLALVSRLMQEPGVHQIVTTNPEFVMAAQTNDAFRDILWAADLAIPDGVGLIYASRWLKTPLPERVPGSELVYHLADLAAARGWRLFLLGAAPGVAAEAGRLLQARYPGLVIAGFHAGTPSPAANDEIVAQINASRADLLYVAYGAPAQDLWIARNRGNLTTVRLAIGVGGALDFITGRSVRAPQWMQRLGLEWLFRLLREPWRWRRMLALPRFALKIAFQPRRQA